MVLADGESYPIAANYVTLNLGLGCPQWILAAALTPINVQSLLW